MRTANNNTHPNKGISSSTTVLCAQKIHAKCVKTALEKRNYLDKTFRMTKVFFSTPDEEGASSFERLNNSHQQLNEEAWILTLKECISIPVTPDCMANLLDGVFASSSPSSFQDDENDGEWINHIVGYGTQICPFSTAVLGNPTRQRTPQNNAADAINGNDSIYKQTQKCSLSCDGSLTSSKNTSLTIIQQVLLDTMLHNLGKKSQDNEPIPQPLNNSEWQISVTRMVQSLSNRSCPNKLETIGDDKTLVIPRLAFHIKEKEFGNLIKQAICTSNKLEVKRDGDSKMTSPDGANENRLDHVIMQSLWSNLAQLYGTSRVIRRGDIDPESKIRESGHSILWPSPRSCDLEQTGPNSPGWITVTENSIHQSFDLTRVMFSRGNITEKIRFGQKLVQQNEVILDMYAGIGYYTLPALIHGKALHVFACEWNPNALFALRYNIRANGIMRERVTFLEGDCRITVGEALAKARKAKAKMSTSMMKQSSEKEEEEEAISKCNALIDGVDRVSLGLLPSSEGGWVTAIQSLRSDKGGWLHIHGNVSQPERDQWMQWVCIRLSEMVKTEKLDREGKPCNNWFVICNNVEKVKSFAPRVHHYVADIFVGPTLPHLLHDIDTKEAKIGYVDNDDGSFVPFPGSIDPPSCALDKNGVLNQEWMMNG